MPYNIPGQKKLEVKSKYVGQDQPQGVIDLVPISTPQPTPPSSGSGGGGGAGGGGGSGGGSDRGYTPPTPPPDSGIGTNLTPTETVAQLQTQQTDIEKQIIELQRIKSHIRPGVEYYTDPSKTRWRKGNLIIADIETSITQLRAGRESLYGFEKEIYQGLPEMVYKKTAGGYEGYVDIERWQSKQNNIVGEVASYVFPSMEDQISRMKQQFWGQPSKDFGMGYSTKVAHETQYRLTKQYETGDYLGLAGSVVSSPLVAIPLSIGAGKALGIGMGAFGASRIGTSTLFTIGTHAITPAKIIGTGTAIGFGGLAVQQTAPIIQRGISTGDYKQMGLELFTTGSLMYAGYKGYQSGYSLGASLGKPQTIRTISDIYETKPGRYEYTVKTQGQKNILSRGIIQQQRIGDEMYLNINRGYNIRTKGLFFKRNVYQPYRTISLSKSNYIRDIGDWGLSKDVTVSQIRTGSYQRQPVDIFKPMKLTTTGYKTTLGISGFKTIEPGETFIENIGGKNFLGSTKTKTSYIVNIGKTSTENIFNIGKISYPKNIAGGMGDYTGGSSLFDIRPVTSTRLDVVMPGGIGTQSYKSGYPVLMPSMVSLFGRAKYSVEDEDMAFGSAMVSSQRNMFSMRSKNLLVSPEISIGAITLSGVKPESISSNLLGSRSLSKQSSKQASIQVSSQQLGLGSVQVPMLKSGLRQKTIQKTVSLTVSSLRTVSTNKPTPGVFGLPGGTPKHKKKRRDEDELFGTGKRLRVWKIKDFFGVIK